MDRMPVRGNRISALPMALAYRNGKIQTRSVNVAFKEWAIVCEALGAGLQSILLRKGGIAEGREGFAFRHDKFFLFPTAFHAQMEKTVLPAGTPLPTVCADPIEIRFAAVVDWTRFLTDPAQLRALRGYHILSDDVVEERFRYDTRAGLHIAFVRVFRMEPPWILAMEKRFGGCRSWINLPSAPEISMTPVLSDEEQARRSRALREALE
jgi:hypothetical protein